MIVSFIQMTGMKLAFTKNKNNDGTDESGQRKLFSCAGPY